MVGGKDSYINNGTKKNGEIGAKCRGVMEEGKGLPQASKV
jgi:hypothetical protein